MDFDIPQNEHTQFMYVLPFTETTALVECTRFGKVALTQLEADGLLDHYIQWKYGAYRLMSREQGVIPMCTARQIPGFDHPNWVDTGGRAGNIKPSTGYSFISSCCDAERIANGRIRRDIPPRFYFYDRLLLHLLDGHPLLGKTIFLKLFRTTKMPLVVRFLREETSIVQELPILAGLPLRPFLGAASWDILSYRTRAHWPVLAVALFQILAIQLGWHYVSAGVLVAGLLLIGLPHGAIDHLLETARAETPIDPSFIMRYLLLSAAIGLIWWMSAPMGLLVFLIYSAWHFGETEYHTTQQKSGLLSHIWGFSMLGLVLGTHPTETTQILAEMNVDLPFIIQSQWGWAFMIVVMALNLGRGLIPFLGGLYAFTLPFVPLLHAFGIYFLFDHSFKSALQIGGRLQVGYRKLYVKAIPFTIGALLLGWGFYAFNIWQTAGATGLFFILLSCLSFPHVMAMTRFYQK
jgi:Brp/Blh family beta-carotene 15,15'-monooxygenase